jgi:hypothetical protein
MRRNVIYSPALEILLLLNGYNPNGVELLGKFGVD